MDKNEIRNHLYNDSVPQALKYVDSIKDEETLFVYAQNYNWDNGLEVPEAILKNNYCTISVALMMFYAGDGYYYLQERDLADGTGAWKEFIDNLYKRILKNSFKQGKTSFDPQLTKVQEFKIKKTLNEAEMVFLTPIEGVDCYSAL